MRFFGILLLLSLGCAATEVTLNVTLHRGVNFVSASAERDPRPINNRAIAVTTLNSAPPAKLFLTPPAAAVPVATSHVVLATVRDKLDQPVPGVPVRFQVKGSVEVSGVDITDSDGQATFTYSGPLQPGTDTIRAYADANDNGREDPTEPFGSALKAWVLPAAVSAGRLIGDGETRNADGTGKISFDFKIEAADRLKGQCTAIDLLFPLTIVCDSVTALSVTGAHASFSGTVKANQTPTTFQVEIDDLGAPGNGLDVFMIRLGTGYSAGGVLTRGDIQINN